MKISIVFIFVFSACSAQLKFGGSSGSSGSSGTSSTNNKQSQTDVDTRFFGLTSGNQGIDGGILGLGAGLLGGAVLSGALNGGGNSNGCGRKRRQADGTNTKFLGALLGGGSGGCNCGRKRRQAPGEDQPGTRFFGLDTLLGGGNSNCCNCGTSNNYPSNNYPSNNYPSNNSPSNNYPTQSYSCQCNNNLTFQDQYGNTNGACRRADETGRTWCYTNGGCSDGRQSQRFPSNPWSYQACNSNGKK
eukprot:GFUD01118365.1.p1 GENE.GFUD01118365.1~~GFUD01118365.1.p1  ORF type:complete len:245 (+),score=57.98 GFUD01118365.1:32-766(+)